MNWSNVSVRQGGRGAGKTYEMMTEIHEQMRSGWGVIVVFPAYGWIHWWIPEFRKRFPGATVPEYTTITNVLKTRGRRFDKLFVEDIDSIDDGIYNAAFDYMLPGMVGSPNPEMIVTASPIVINQDPYSITPDVDRTRKRTADRLRRMRRDMETNGEVVAIAVALEVMRHDAERAD